MNYYAFKNSQETEVLDFEVKNSIRKNSDNCEQGKPYPQEQANVRIEDSVRASTGKQRDGGSKTERRCNQCVICGAEMPEGDQVCGYCRRKHGY